MEWVFAAGTLTLIFREVASGSDAKEKVGFVGLWGLYWLC